MLFYLSLFILFIALYKFAERTGSWFLLLIAILVPTLFEGLRDEVVGEDMLGYGADWFYQMNVKGGLADMFYFAQTPEYGFHLLIYFCKLLLPDIHLYMTACALIKMTMVTLTAYKFREQLSSALFMFSYYCFFYVTCFSLMRQGVAVAICFYSLTYFLNGDIKKFLITILVAYFFHNSAVLMLLLIPIYYIRNFRYKYLLIFGGILIVYFFVEQLFEFVLMTPLFKSEMAELYLDSGVPSAKSNILIAAVFFCYGYYLQRFDEEDNQDNVYLLLMTAATTLLFLFLASFIEVAFRMSYYMFITSLLLVLMFIFNAEKYQRPLVLGYISLFLLHFYLSCQHGLAGALNYTSEILGIGIH